MKNKAFYSILCVTDIYFFPFFYTFRRGELIKLVKKNLMVKLPGKRSLHLKTFLKKQQ